MKIRYLGTILRRTCGAWGDGTYLGTHHASKVEVLEPVEGFSYFIVEASGPWTQQSIQVERALSCTPFPATALAGVGPLLKFDTGTAHST